MNAKGIHSSVLLSQEELNEVRRLADLCNEHENIDLKLNWNMLKERSGQETNDFLFYENGQLIGFLGIYQFHSAEVEISGMVHPLHRRKGIFGELVRAAQQECIRRDVPKLVFICMNGSSSGKAFLEALGAKYSFSEYWMKLDDSAGGIGNRNNVLGITLRPAEPRDVPAIVHLNTVGFDMSEEDALKFVENTRESPSKRTFAADVRNEDGSLRTVGKINFRLDDGKAFIYGFVVGVDDRGRGYGRAILNETVAVIKGQDETASVALEVAVVNERALGLYESCGFRISKATDYYEWVQIR